ncbi:MAG: class I SAM-dependent methyltransferase [Candidatus Ratteibacteria bacterium]|jgi:predicted O-methyltransferase YrrM
MKKIFLNKIISFCDFFLMPLTFVSAVLLLGIRKAGMQRMVWSKKIFMKVGVFPIRDHYYEPLFNPKHLKKSLRKDRELPGLNFNDSEQLQILNKFNYNKELEKIPKEKTDLLEFYYRNPSIGPGDSEYLYNMVRLFKPRKIVEIGCGYSTLMAINAVRQNKKENQDYFCEHVCIEPYENKWLESLNLKVFREKIENIEKKILKDLEANDILFIDSSHIIRPQGDVLFEYLEILPILRKGVLVHIHDIFIPKDYLDEWVLKDVKLWNEQYILEAFLTFNNEYRIIGALNYLKHHYSKEIYNKCPILANETNEEPCSFWLVKA